VQGDLAINKPSQKQNATADERGDFNR